MMADAKLKITVTLTDENVKEAVADWLNHQGAIGDMAHWTPQDVTVGATMEWRGNGVQETQVAVAKIEARK
jgi:hypothetical protein